MNDDSPPLPSRPPHPLAIALIERLRARSGARVLEIGAGSGRNTAALAAAGFTVVSLAQAAPHSCAGALSTHALLHGTRREWTECLDAIRAALEPGAPLYATFGSVHDARYGAGERREPEVFAPLDGDEAGVAHVYFDRAGLATILGAHFLIEHLEERAVDAIAGTWAHQQAPLRGAVHWFARLVAR